MDLKNIVFLTFICAIVATASCQSPAASPTFAPAAPVKAPAKSPVTAPPTASVPAPQVSSPPSVTPASSPPAAVPVSSPPTIESPPVPEPVSSPAPETAPTPEDAAPASSKKNKGNKDNAPLPAPVSDSLAPGSEASTSAEVADESGAEILKSVEMVVGSFVVALAAFTCL